MWNKFNLKLINNILKNSYEKDIHKLIKLKPNGSVLDISIGNGINSEFFIKNGYDVYGTDISKIAIKNMSKKYPNHNWLKHNTKNKFPYKKNMFDIIFAKFSLHYFSKKSLYHIMNDIYRILKPNGIFYIMIKLSNTGNTNTNKKIYTINEWFNFIKNFRLIDTHIKIKKAYSFEKNKSIILTIIITK